MSDSDRVQLRAAASQLASQLKQHRKLLVLAESCTAGLVAASISEIPGISEFLCGSAVVYQVATKVEWLEIEPAVIDAYNVVSEQVAQAMARQVLKKTSRADLAGAITGHLGPNADPPELDGIAWCAVADRHGKVETRRLKLSTSSETGNLRVERHVEAAIGLMTFLSEFLDAQSRTDASTVES